VKLSWQRYRIPLHHPWNIAGQPRQDVPRKEKLIIRIEHKSHVGLGEASPVSYYNQSIDSSERTVKEAAAMLGDDPFALERILSALRERFPDQPAAIAAIDGALYDLIGKLLDIPLWKYFGLDRDRYPLTSFSIGIDDLEMIETKVREAEAYPLLKVKIGTPNDEETLETIRRVAPDKPIRVDANGAWTPETMLADCKRLNRFNLEMIEQPVARGNDSHVPQLRERTATPIFADESCHTLDDVLECGKYYDGINIKLCKSGGVREAVRMIHAARAAGLKIMLGCMVETSVGIATAAQLAPMVDMLDLDGHLLLAGDPFTGIGGARGRLTLTDRPGIGVIPGQSP